ncbi:Acyltransferase family protein [compost metagenome]
MLPVSEIYPVERTIPHYLASFFAGFSHQAVMVFFVLSGFLVGGALLKEYDRGHIRTDDYLIKRLSRLWCVLIPTFIFTCVVDLLIMSLLGSSPSPFFPVTIREYMSYKVLACNIFFLQTAFCGQFGNNGPLWSIFNEFWYYIIWLAVVMACDSRKRQVTRLSWGGFAIVISAVLTAAQFDGFSLIPYMAIWLLGVGAARVRRSILSTRISILVFIALLLLLRVAIRREFWESSPIGTYVFDVMVGISFSSVLVSMRNSGAIKFPPGGKLNRILAGFSFTLYCIHAPILDAYGALVDKFVVTVYRQNMSDYHHWVLLFTPICISLACAYGMSLIGERQTYRIRTMMKKMTHNRSRRMQ